MVTTPVRRLLRRAVSTAALAGWWSSVGAGVAQLEALVDEREVRDDRAQGGEGDGGPVGVARRPEVVASDAAGGVGPQPVDRLAPGRLGGGQADAPGREPLGHG